MTVGVVCAFRLDLTAPRNRSSGGTATEGLFHPGRRFPSGGQDQSRPEGAVDDSDWSWNRPVWTSRPRRPACPAIVPGWPWSLLSPAARRGPIARPRRPRSVPSPSPAWAGTKSPPRDGDGYDYARGPNAAGIV